VWLWLPWEWECEDDEPFVDDELSELELDDDVDELEDDVDEFELSELLLADEELSELLEVLEEPDLPRLSVL
jgi:hypothetical protein